jgi:hypothetical protein
LQVAPVGQLSGTAPIVQINAQFVFVVMPSRAKMHMGSAVPEGAAGQSALLSLHSGEQMPPVTPVMVTDVSSARHPSAGSP